MSHPSITGSGAGSFPVKLGHWTGFLNDYLSLLGGTATTNVLTAAQLPARLAQQEVDHANGTADYLSIDGLAGQITTLQQTLQSAGPTSIILTFATNDLVNMVNADTPMQTPGSLLEALTKVQNFMIADSANVNQGTLPAVGAQTIAFSSPVGNPVFVWSAKDSAGRALQYVFPEVVTVTVTSDSQTGSATAGQEPYSVLGQNAQSNFLAFDWLSSKYGSGATGAGNLVDPLTNFAGGTTGNLLVNGAFLVATTANVADNWTIATGAAGSTVTVTAASGGYISGSGIVTMVSDGSTLIAITQAFNTASVTTVGAGGTPYALAPSAINNTEYAAQVVYKLSVASPAAGVMEVALTDASGTIINDDQGTANSFTVALTGVGDTNYHVATGVFRLPQSLSANTPLKLRIRQSTAVTSGKNLILSCVAMTTLTQLYAGGPYFAGFRGSTNPVASGLQFDAWTFAVTYTPGKLQTGFWRLFNPPSLGPQTPGIIIPAVTSPGSLPDSLVV